MKRIFLVLFILDFSIKLFSEPALAKLENINQSQRPYNENALSLIIKDYSVTKYEVGKIKPLGEISVNFDNSCVINFFANKYEINIGNKQFEKNRESFTILVKYLQGIFYGNIIPNESYVVFEENNKIVYQYDYEYKGQKCYNKYYIEDGKFYRSEVFKKVDETPLVTIEYSYIEKNGKRYMVGSNSDNKNNGIIQKYVLEYIENGDTTVPKIIKVISIGNGIRYETKYHVVGQIIR